jgi:hypothetical protein
MLYHAAPELSKRPENAMLSASSIWPAARILELIEFLPRSLRVLQQLWTAVAAATAPPAAGRAADAAAHAGNDGFFGIRERTQEAS